MVPLVLETNQNRGCMGAGEGWVGLKSGVYGGGGDRELPSDMSPAAHWQHLLYGVTIKACHP